MKLYEDVRELAAIDLNSIVAQYLRATMLPNQGFGQTITEIVSGQDITFTAPLVWNADGSVTQNELVANGEKQTLAVSPSADLHTDDVIVVVHSINNSSNGGNKAPMLGWYGTGARDLVIQSYTWGVNTRATVKESWETLTVNSTKNAASSNEFVVYHWISATNTLNQYEDGVLTGAAVGTINASNPLTTLKLSLGLANDKFFSSQLYSKFGAFTNTEVNEIVHNPYGAFQSQAAQLEEYSGAVSLSSATALNSSGNKSIKAGSTINSQASYSQQGAKASFGSQNLISTSSIDQKGNKQASGNSLITSSVTFNVAGVADNLIKKTGAVSLTSASAIITKGIKAASGKATLNNTSTFYSLGVKHSGSNVSLMHEAHLFNNGFKSAFSRVSLTFSSSIYARGFSGNSKPIQHIKVITGEIKDTVVLGELKTTTIHGVVSKPTVIRGIF